MFQSFFANRNKNKLKDEKFLFLFEEAPLDEVIVFDTETTGLNPKKDEILSIGAVKIKGNKILTSEKFEIFLKLHNNEIKRLSNNINVSSMGLNKKQVNI